MTEQYTVTGLSEHSYRPTDPQEAGIIILRVGGIRVLVTDKRRYFATLDAFDSAA